MIKQKEKKGKRIKEGEEKTVSASKERERDMHDRRARKSIKQRNVWDDEWGWTYCTETDDVLL